MKLSLPKQSNGSIDIVEFFRVNFSASQLKVIYDEFSINPLFEEDLTLNNELMADIKDLISDKLLEDQMKEIVVMTPEFKEHVIQIINQLIRFEQSMQ